MLRCTGSESFCVRQRLDAAELRLTSVVDTDPCPLTTSKYIRETRRGNALPQPADTRRATHGMATPTLLRPSASNTSRVSREPPYNTGGDLIYNDKYLQKEDAFRHSKWLSFMERRLRVARELLSDTGVIIVAIDDNEHAHLRLLMDEIFGGQNFLAMVTWQGMTSRNDSRFTSGGNDYMLIYGRSRENLIASDARWLGTKRGYDKFVAAAQGIWKATAPDIPEAQKQLRAWVRANAHTLEKGLQPYTHFDPTGALFRPTSLARPEGDRPNLRYDLLHPSTNTPVPMHANGWRYSKERMSALVASGRIIFGRDHTATPQFKRFLAESETQAVRPLIEHERAAATKRLVSILGERRFDFPKDEIVLARWINIVTSNNRDAVVLDFFGGSGSTAHAVMDMNAADGGNRQCILVTNNEVEEKQRKQLVKDGHFPGDPEFDKHGIFRHVTYPRIKTVATGIREDGSTYSEGLTENVTFSRMTYTTRQSVKIGREFNTIAPLVWSKAGGRGPILTVDGPDLPQHLLSQNYGVLFEAGAGAVADFAVAIEDAGLEDGADVFVVTDDDTRYAHAWQRLTNFTVHRLYEDYLSNFEVRA